MAREKRRWSFKDDDVLSKHYHLICLSEINKKLSVDRAKNTIYNRARFLGIADKCIKWTSQEDELLCACRQLGLSYEATSKQFDDREEEGINQRYPLACIQRYYRLNHK